MALLPFSQISSCFTLPLFASLFFDQPLRLNVTQELPPLPALITVPVIGSVGEFYCRAS